jgi:hypothetical protein
MNRQLDLVLMLLCLCGCSADGPAAPETAGTARTKRADDRSGDDTARTSFGPIRFTSPTGWIPNRPKDGEVCFFAPEPDRWRKFGFRPNLGIRLRPHPGVSLDEFRKMLDRALADSADRLNETIVASAKKEANSGIDISFQGRPRYTIEARERDGTRVLCTTCWSAFELPEGIVVTKTHGMQFLGPDALYTVSLTFPQEVEKEMDQIWESFVKSLRIEK